MSRSGHNPLPYSLLAGIVPCPRGWAVMTAKLQAATCLPEDAFVAARLADVLDYRPSFSVIAMHAPVGLNDAAGAVDRTCDHHARAVLGWPRRTSVLSVPSRAALTAPTYEEALILDGSLSKLTYQRFKWLREVDQEMAPFRQRIVFEAHPELSLHLLNDDTPMRFSKYWQEGYEERLQLLSVKFPGLERLVNQPVRGASRVHLMDAAAVLWTARRIAGRVVSRLPADDAEWDSSGLRMEIVR